MLTKVTLDLDIRFQRARFFLCDEASSRRPIQTAGESTLHKTEGTLDTAMRTISREAQEEHFRQILLIQKQKELRKEFSEMIKNLRKAREDIEVQPARKRRRAQRNVPNVNQPTVAQNPQNITANQAPPVQAASVPAQMIRDQQQGNTVGDPVAQPIMPLDRTVIWNGVLEWTEISKNDAQRKTWQLPNQVSATLKNGNPEVKAESWPEKLFMQICPKMLIDNIWRSHIKKSKSVLFHPSACEALECLINSMSIGLAGCINITSTRTRNFKVLLLIYEAENRTFTGLMPNDSQTFVEDLRELIQEQKTKLPSSMPAQRPATLQPTTSGIGHGSNATVNEISEENV